jgi:hypothetical protein
MDAIHISSSNTNPLYAKEGDTIVLNFTANRNLSGVSATINGYPATIS